MANEKRLIDADALTRRLCEERDDVKIEHACDIGYHNGLNMAVSMTINAPTVDAEPVAYGAWIPVTERLPEEWVNVLVWSWCGFHETAVYLGIPGKWRATWNHDLLEENIVTHWMPLPEPPKDVTDINVGNKKEG